MPRACTMRVRSIRHVGPYLTDISLCCGIIVSDYLYAHPYICRVLQIARRQARTHLRRRAWAWLQVAAAVLCCATQLRQPSSGKFKKRSWIAKR
eukprot:COSAG01_NODE_6991_length_3401_cov_3.070000_6_plen_94_part_00